MTRPTPAQAIYPDLKTPKANASDTNDARLAKHSRNYAVRRESFDNRRGHVSPLGGLAKQPQRKK